MQVRVSETGEVTIPKPLRDQLGICAGQALDLSVHEGRLVAVLADTVVDPTAAFGSLKHLSMTTDELMEILRGPRDDT